MSIPTLSNAVLIPNFKNTILALLKLIKANAFTNDDNSKWNAKGKYDLVLKTFWDQLNRPIFLLLTEPCLSKGVQDLICLFFFNRWKKQGPYADQQKMNVIFLKRVQVTPLGVPRTNSKQMELLARMQKATASWGDVLPGMTSALNCLIMVRDCDKWVIDNANSQYSSVIVLYRGKDGK